MANITAPVITELAGQGLPHIIWPGSMFVFSGVINTQVDQVTSALDAIGLKLRGTREQGDWVLLITQRLWE
jgi:ribosomal protein L11 methylase PrmA